jgi:myo-inositol 2-dehydrogenase/D-chiro-inositol 1-dehydrogenase
MGADHVSRLASTVRGVRVTAIVEPDAGRADAAALLAPGSRTFARLEDALEAEAVDALLVASPARFHESALMTAMDAGIPTLCEKPLTEDPESAWRLIEAEKRLGRRLVQVGFMRRFDPEYVALRELIVSGRAGELLMLHCSHRAPSTPSAFTQEMRITDSAAHEFDIIPWLAESPIVNLEVRIGKTTTRAGVGVREPMLMLMELASGVLVDLEINLSSQYGYQIGTDAVFESGVARLGQPSSLEVWHAGSHRSEVAQSFTVRFREAYLRQLQAWADATALGTTVRPSMWDGFAVAVACGAGVRALAEDRRIVVDLPPVPELYRAPRHP